jgi:septum formation protein
MMPFARRRWHTVLAVSNRPRFVLASASPARLSVLRAAGLDPEVIVSGVDESTVEASDAITLCASLARLKAQAVANELRITEPTVVLGCDSVLEFDGEVLGKPASDADTVERWRRMRGRSGILHTGHCLVDVDSRSRVEAVASTTVHFAVITDEEIEAYVGTGEPAGVAGGFTIDGLGGWFVDRIDGDAGTVIGVSLPLLRSLLGDLGLGVPQFWAARLVSGS